MSATIHVHRIAEVSARQHDSGTISVCFENHDGKALLSDQVFLYWQNLTQAIDDISGLLQQLGNIAYNRALAKGELDDKPEPDAVYVGSREDPYG